LRMHCSNNRSFPNSRQREANAIPPRFGLGVGGQNSSARIGLVLSGAKYFSFGPRAKASGPIG
jgi:hypothetical protein